MEDGDHPLCVIPNRLLPWLPGRMTTRLVILTITLPILAGISCAPQKRQTLPQGWEPSEPPRTNGYDPETVTAAARQLLGLKTGSVALVTMNSCATEEDLSRIIEEMQGDHQRKEPLICLSTDAGIVADAVGRTLVKFPDVDLAGLWIVVASPNTPSGAFLDLLKERRIAYFHMRIEPR